ncbi:hypothetical protein Tco_0800535 [Tanacetum coccineum]|uniref:Uncharacterized protein n=1 Tax=Tanacetum coccineum TaxID=301880 RepID=A0ABQ4ZXH8_9ASTR
MVQDIIFHASCFYSELRPSLDLLIAGYGSHRKFHLVPTSVLVKWLPFTNRNSDEAQTSSIPINRGLIQAIPTSLPPQPIGEATKASNLLGLKALLKLLLISTARVKLVLLVKIEENILSSCYCLYTVNAAGVEVTTLVFRVNAADMEDDVDISALTIEQYIALLPNDIKPGIVNPKIGDDV